MNIYGIFDECGKLIERIYTRSDDDCNDSWAFELWESKVKTFPEIYENSSFRLLESFTI